MADNLLLDRLDKFASYGFSQTEIRQVSRLVAEALAATARMQRGIEEEERCFKQFGVWLHFGRLADFFVARSLDG